VLTDAVITLFRAAKVGALTEDHSRCLFTESGEMRRWKEAEHETPEGLKSSIPSPLDANALICLAESASRLEQLDDASSLEEPVISGRKDFLPVESASCLLPHSATPTLRCFQQPPGRISRNLGAP
jgi:hypothetical protein